MSETPTLTDFLLARIAEDEADAEAHPDPNMWDGNPRGWFDPDRVQAECDAKRRILKLHKSGAAWCDHCSGWYGPDPAADCPTLKLVALPYADHEDYRDDWRPDDVT